jgi:hypothetical protein
VWAFRDSHSYSSTGARTLLTISSFVSRSSDLPRSSGNLPHAVLCGCTGVTGLSVLKRHGSLYSIAQTLRNPRGGAKSQGLVCLSSSTRQRLHFIQGQVKPLQHLPRCLLSSCLRHLFLQSTIRPHFAEEDRSAVIHVFRSNVDGG